MSRYLIEQAMACQQPEGWLSDMSTAKLVRPETRPQHLEGEGREAAVMLLIFPGQHGSLCSVLTRRQDSLQHHPGQVSLPGGGREQGESLEQTALRETEEELGVDRNSIEVLGTLNQIYIPPSDFTVTPFVGWLSSEPAFVIQTQEVAELIRFRLTSVMEKSAKRLSSVDSDTKDRDVPWFSIEDQQVWGATAMILDDFGQRLRKVQPS